MTNLILSYQSNIMFIEIRVAAFDVDTMIFVIRRHTHQNIFAAHHRRTT